MERPLPSFVALVDQTLVRGPPEQINDGAGPPESRLPTHHAYGPSFKFVLGETLFL